MSLIERNEDIWQSNVDVVCVLTNQSIRYINNYPINPMGGGIAKEAANRYNMWFGKDELEKKYANLLMSFPDAILQSLQTKFIHQEWLAFPTINKDYNADSNLIRKSLNQLRIFSDIYPNKLIGLPRPGSGIGGLDWDKQVKPTVNRMLRGYYDRIHIFYK